MDGFGESLVVNKQKPTLLILVASILLSTINTVQAMPESAIIN